MVTIHELLAELDQEAETTRRVLARVPADHVHWRPHERSLTLGQLAMHVATLPGALADISTRSFDVATEIPRPGASSADELVATLDRSVEQARRVLRDMGDDGLCAPWRLTSGDVPVMEIPRVAFLRSTLFNHWYHHRGQLTVYLRQVGAPVPAIYGPSADESPFAA